jgi:hypothetical protein
LHCIDVAAEGFFLSKIVNSKYYMQIPPPDYFAIYLGPFRPCSDGGGEVLSAVKQKSSLANPKCKMLAKIWQGMKN